jgi:hypothetical protein
MLQQLVASACAARPTGLRAADVPQQLPATTTTTAAAAAAAAAVPQQHQVPKILYSSAERCGIVASLVALARTYAADGSIAVVRASGGTAADAEADVSSGVSHVATGDLPVSGTHHSASVTSSAAAAATAAAAAVAAVAASATSTPADTSGVSVEQQQGRLRFDEALSFSKPSEARFYAVLDAKEEALQSHAPVQQQQQQLQQRSASNNAETGTVRSSRSISTTAAARHSSSSSRAALVSGSAVLSTDRPHFSNDGSEDSFEFARHEDHEQQQQQQRRWSIATDPSIAFTSGSEPLYTDDTARTSKVNTMVRAMRLA